MAILHLLMSQQPVRPPSFPHPRPITVMGSVTLILTLLNPLASWAAEAAFKFDDKSQKVTQKMLDELSANHYQKVTINDEFSKGLLSHYLESLDPAKIIFLASDVQEFQQYAFILDDQLRTGRLEAAEKIFTRFHERNKALLTYTLKDIQRYGKPYNGKNPEIELDRKNATWPTSLEESTDLWDKRIFNEAILLQLAEKADDITSMETLEKRYRNRLKNFEALESKDAFELFINSVLDLYDPHTEWQSPQSEENFKINMSLSLEGIGAVLQQEDEKTKIVRLTTGGPAAKSGALQAGDFILAVAQGREGELEDISGQRLDQVVQKVRGPKGSIVRLQIQSANNQAIKVVMIERDKIKLEDQAAKSAIYENKGNQIGVINIPSFYLDFDAARRGDKDYRSTTRDVEKLLRELMESKVDGVVIDLRNNGGGSLQEARLLTNLFVSQGPIVQIRNSYNQIDRSLRADQPPVYLGPLLVLTNRFSASASEIFAGAIQDYERGIILGEPTFGKGTVQTIADLNYGQLKFTNAKFYRISGESTQHRGVLPDIITPSIFDFEEIGESALEHALAWDSIHESSHAHYDEIKPYVTELTLRHQKRMEKNPDYHLLQDRIAFRDSKKKIKTLSLNEQVRQQQRDQDNVLLLNMTNQNRTQKKLPLFKTIEELEKDEEARAAKWNGVTVIDFDDDFLLRESAAVLMDFIELKSKANKPTVAVIKQNRN